jgi:hypothetical protein
VCGRANPASPSLLTLIDEIQRDQRWNTRLMVFAANTLALPNNWKTRWDKNLLTGALAQIIPADGHAVDKSYSDLIAALDGAVVTAWPSPKPADANTRRKK